MNKFFRIISIFLFVALSFTALPHNVQADTTYNFTTFTENDDVNNYLTVQSSSNITWSNIRSDGTGYPWLIKTETITGNFLYSFTVRRTGYTAPGVDQISLFAVEAAGASGNPGAAYAANQRVVSVMLFQDSGEIKIYSNNTTGGQASSAITLALNTTYTVYLERSTNNITMKAYNSIGNQIGATQEINHGIANFGQIVLTARAGFTGGAGSAATNSGWLSNLVKHTLGVPVVQTYPAATPGTDGLLLWGVGSTSSGALLTAGFNIGTSSGNYTNNLAANITDVANFSTIYAAANLTYGQVYYFQAWATNANGIGYGGEQFVQWSPNLIAVTTGTAIITQTPSVNFSAVFPVNITPIFLTANVTVELADNVGFSSLIETFFLQAYNGDWFFSTVNTTGIGSSLSENTTYFYRGKAEYNNVEYWGSIKQFTTGEVEILSPPTVTIRSVRDVSDRYGASQGTTMWIFEVTTQITSNNITDNYYEHGMMFGESLLTPTVLAQPFQTFWTNDLAPDNTYVQIFRLAPAHAPWYDGGILFFQAYLQTEYNGMVTSPIVKFTPGTDFELYGLVAGTTSITVISDQVDSLRLRLGLTGIMGAWALLVILELAIALIFGIALIWSQDKTVKVGIAVAWVITSIGVFSGFLFSGTLGLWSVIIIVSIVAAGMVIFASRKLSGGEV